MSGKPAVGDCSCDQLSASHATVWRISLLSMAVKMDSRMLGNESAPCGLISKKGDLGRVVKGSRGWFWGLAEGKTQHEERPGNQSIPMLEEFRTGFDVGVQMGNQQGLPQVSMKTSKTFMEEFRDDVGKPSWKNTVSF